MRYAQDITSGTVAEAAETLDRDRRYRCLNPKCQARVTLRISPTELMAPFFAHFPGEGAKTGCDLYLPGQALGYAYSRSREDERAQEDYLGFELALKGPKHLDWQLEVRLPKSESRDGNLTLRLGPDVYHNVSVATMEEATRRFDLLPCSEDLGVIDAAGVSIRYLERLQPQTMKIETGMIKAFHSSGLGYRYRAVGSSLFWGSSYYFVWKTKSDIDFPLALNKKLVGERAGWSCASVTLPPEGSATVAKWLFKHLELKVEGRKAELTLVHPANWNRTPSGDIFARCGSTLMISLHRRIREPLRDSLLVESASGIRRFNISAHNNVMLIISRDPSSERFLYIRFGIEPGYLIDCDAEAVQRGAVGVVLRATSRSGKPYEVSLQSPAAIKVLDGVRSGQLADAELFCSGNVSGTLRWRSPSENDWRQLPVDHVSTAFTRVDPNFQKTLSAILRRKHLSIVLDFHAFGFQVIPRSVEKRRSSLTPQLEERVRFLTMMALETSLDESFSSTSRRDILQHVSRLKLGVHFEVLRAHVLRELARGVMTDNAS